MTTTEQTTTELGEQVAALQQQIKVALAHCIDARAAFDAAEQALEQSGKDYRAKRDDLSRLIFPGENY